MPDAEAFLVFVKAARMFCDDLLAIRDNDLVGIGAQADWTASVLAGYRVGIGIKLRQTMRLSRILCPGALITPLGIGLRT